LPLLFSSTLFLTNCLFPEYVFFPPGYSFFFFFFSLELTLVSLCVVSFILDSPRDFYVSGGVVFFILYGGLLLTEFLAFFICPDSFGAFPSESFSGI